MFVLVQQNGVIYPKSISTKQTSITTKHRDAQALPVYCPVSVAPSVPETHVKNRYCLDIGNSASTNFYLHFFSGVDEIYVGSQYQIIRALLIMPRFFEHHFFTHPLLYNCTCISIYDTWIQVAAL